MPWTPGASGNPRGRPPKSRALTAILEKAGSTSVATGELKDNGKPQTISRKTLVAHMLWEAAAHGQVQLRDANGNPGAMMTLDADQWLSVVKFLFTQIDGPPKVSLLDVPDDVTTEIKFVRVEGRKASAPDNSNLDADDAA